MKFLRTRSVIELRERYGTRLKWVVLGTTMVGMMAAVLSSTVVFVIMGIVLLVRPAGLFGKEK